MSRWAYSAKSVSNKEALVERAGSLIRSVSGIQRLVGEYWQPSAWVRLKKRQIVSILTNNDLKTALASTGYEPEEYAAYRVGEVIHVNTNNADCREFQVCGVRYGGNADVVTVIDKQEMKAYCLKASRASLVDENIKNQRLRTEARIWLSLGIHPHIVTADSVYEINDQPYILIEYVSGADLHSVLKRGPLTLYRALKYALHICRAMSYAQRVLPGFVHGDIKPGNCMITQDDELKVTDFGEAYADELYAEKFGVLDVATDKLNPAKLNYHRRGGTLPYMAPEKFGASATPDVRGDVYSFGVTLYQMLTGTAPFMGPKREDYENQHLNLVPPDPCTLNREIPAGLGGLILSCIAKSAFDRPDSFNLLEDKLTSVMCDATGEQLPCSSVRTPNVHELIRRGDSFAVLGLGEAAVDFLNAASVLDPVAAEVWAKKAMVFASSSQRHKADRCIEMAVSLDTSSFVTSISCARALSLLGRDSEALTFLDSALRKRPFSAHAWNYKGEAQLALSNYPLAERSFRKAIAKDRNHIEPYKNIARLYTKIGKYDRAISFVSEVLRIAPNDCATLVMLGDAYEATGRHKESIEAYKRAMDLGRDTYHVRKHLFKVSCTLYRASGGHLNREFIRPFYASLLRKNRTDHKFLAGLQHLFRKRNFDPLILFFVDQELYSMLNQLNVGGRTTIADLLVEVERHSAEHRQIVEWRYSVGRLYYGLDMFDECLRIFSWSLEENERDEKALYYVAACHEVKGNFRAASGYYEKALKLNPACSLNRSGRQRVLAGLREYEVGQSENRTLQQSCLP